MSDLIDRQALLKQIDIDSDGEPGYYGDTWKFIDTIKSMPAAELGTNFAEVGTDCISRQAAIDALRKMQTYKLFSGDDMLLIDQAGAMTELMLLPSSEPKAIINLDVMEVSKEAWNKLKNVPVTAFPVQPEPKRGEWIPKEQRFYCDRCNHIAPKGIRWDFCPNCGADMRTAKQIVHDAIDNTPMAEDAFPGIKERLHKAVDDMREATE